MQVARDQAGRLVAEEATRPLATTKEPTPTSITPAIANLDQRGRVPAVLPVNDRSRTTRNRIAVSHRFQSCLTWQSVEEKPESLQPGLRCT